MRRAIVLGAALLVAIVLPLSLGSEPYWLDMLSTLGYWAVLAGSWNLLAGYTGQISLGHAAFGGIGAYSLAITVTELSNNAIVGMLGGIVLAALMAAIVGALTLRLRGPYFAIATIAFAQVAMIAVQNWKSVTNGTEGIFLPFEPSVANLTFRDPAVYSIIFLVLSVAVVALTVWIVPSRTGVFLRAIRDDSTAAASLGVRVTALKLAVFAVSAAIASVAGALNTARIGYVDPSGTMALQFSIQVALIVMIGGMGHPWGGLVGAIAVIPLQFVLRAELGGRFGAIYLAVYGLIVIVLLRFAPGGLIELVTRWIRTARRRGRPTERGPAPAPAPITKNPELAEDKV